MVRKSRDASRHVREWSKFFEDGGAAAEKMVDEFIQGYRERKYLKQSLERLVARGFLEKRAGKIFPTASGFNFFRRNNGRPAKTKWDGKWRLVSFDVPGGYNTKRDQLRRLLREFEFQPLQKSVWISPNFVADNFWHLVAKNDLHKYCKVMLVDILEGDEELKKRFAI